MFALLFAVSLPAAAQDLDALLAEKAKMREAEKAAAKEAAKPSPTPASSTAQSTPLQSASAVQSEKSPPQAETELERQARLYGVQINREKSWGPTVPAGSAAALRKGALIVGRLEVVETVPVREQGAEWQKITWRAEGGQSFWTLVEPRFARGIFVGQVTHARTWCPLRNLTGGRDAGVELPAQCLDCD